MTKPLVNGRPLNELEIVEIVEQCSLPGHRRFEGGERYDHYRNLEIINAFDGRSERTGAQLVRHFHAQRREWSQHFNALRAGETVQWAIEHGIVKCVRLKPCRRWRLLEPVLQFELVGPEAKQRALRVRGVTGPEAVVAARLWQREQKRRERARLRAIKKFKPVVLQQLDAICHRDPDRSIDGFRDLQPFVVGEHRTFAACRELIEGSLDDMQRLQIYWLMECLKPVVRDLPREPVKPTAEALASLEDLYL